MCVPLLTFNFRSIVWTALESRKYDDLFGHHHYYTKIRQCSGNFPLYSQFRSKCEFFQKILGVNVSRHFGNIHTHLYGSVCLHNKIQHKTVFIWLPYKLAEFDWDDKCWCYICERKCKAKILYSFLVVFFLLFAFLPCWIKFT